MREIDERRLMVGQTPCWLVFVWPLADVDQLRSSLWNGRNPPAHYLEEDHRQSIRGKSSFQSLRWSRQANPSVSSLDSEENNIGKCRARDESSLWRRRRGRWSYVNGQIDGFNKHRINILLINLANSCIPSIPFRRFIFPIFRPERSRSSWEVKAKATTNATTNYLIARCIWIVMRHMMGL